MKIFITIIIFLSMVSCGGGGGGSTEKDKIAPVIKIIGANPLEIIQDESFSDPGATASDDVDGIVNVKINGTVNTTVVASYTVTYTAVDKAGNKATATRIVKVKSQASTTTPQNLQVVEGNKNITYSWDSVTGADKYTLYIAEESGITVENYSIYKNSKILNNVVSPYVIKELKNGTTYYAIITATKNNIESIASGEVSATPRITNNTSKINDTGITLCRNGDNKDVNCPVSNYPNQDAQFGRNTMSFTKISNGQCVKDNVTGLIWEVKQDNNGSFGDSLHDVDDFHTWYKPQNNATGEIERGIENEYTECFGYSLDDPNSFCNTNAYVYRVNKLGWCGYTDWRLPTRKELHSIVDYSRTAPAINITYFPNQKYTKVVGWVWSSKIVVNDPWLVDYRLGTSYPSSSAFPLSVRLVRGK